MASNKKDLERLQKLGEKMRFKSKVDYDSKEDSIYIYKEDGNTKCSLDFEFGVVDIDHDNKVVGVEIFDASDFLEVRKEVLKQAKKGKVRTFQKRDVFGAKFLIKLPKKKIENSMLMPVKKKAF